MISYQNTYWIEAEIILVRISVTKEYSFVLLYECLLYYNECQSEFSQMTTVFDLQYGYRMLKKSDQVYPICEVV